ncbi:collagen alpha-1(XXVII) chain B-like [Dendronephthya gigantea]|uniref:collagen alpha-1(XXVII) chain B-like n=1 Tax=Dendronephthya gigantea TaxID=151771 RepID=UPI00106D18D2|nr:collagen alpha-1(XXVII) chain B-like [Dendronephthya gigantea]
MIVFLIFLSSVFTSDGQAVRKLEGVNKSVVCIKSSKAFGLTIVQGEHGNPGSPGPQGDQGERGYPGYTSFNFYEFQGPRGSDGASGRDGEMGEKGQRGHKGSRGAPGEDGFNGPKGHSGETGPIGQKGVRGEPGETGNDGEDGEPGPDGLTREETELITNALIHSLNDYQVKENGYYNDIYHVTSRDLTDGRSDTGGWGSETAKTGNYVQATFVRPVFVTSVTVAGGFIPSWRHNVRHGYGNLNLQYSTDGRNWATCATFPSPVMQKLVTVNFDPLIAQYWRLISTEDKWVGTTEFALKPLLKA